MKEYKVIVDDYGSIYWYKLGTDTLGRDDGPAIENIIGDKYWYQNGKYHRIDGPAIEFADGTKFWFQNGKLHRLDGPAVEYTDSAKCWYIEGKDYSEQKFKEEIARRNHLSKLCEKVGARRRFCSYQLNDKTMEIDGKKYK